MGSSPPGSFEFEMQRFMQVTFACCVTLSPTLVLVQIHAIASIEACSDRLQLAFGSVQSDVLCQIVLVGINCF